ncbi:undecaprenyl-diphosphate phosphatase [Terrarubrum flagellatum]|uniref:undecaprenyl-diphosphate phosphatase n=1 Tax=Terrirubrum flagellatum TaxID=2895980 RepID=UPI0031451D0A
MDVFKALFLGLIEGLTEFIPVSSTGHLLLVSHFLGFDDDQLGKSYVILVQLGAILALLSVYFFRLWRVALALPTSAEARRFVIGVLVAFLPAAVIGFILREFIKGRLFNPTVVCVALIVGGFILLLMDEHKTEEKYDDAMAFPVATYLKIGFFQCLAMVPGVSRSGATIVGAMLMGATKRAAAEFSFFLAMPTMVGAFTLEAWKSRHEMTGDGAMLIALGFAAAFISGLIVVRFLLDYISRHGFAVFAWWRIVVGAAGLAGLLVFG